MWMDEEPTTDSKIRSPHMTPSLALGAEQASFGTLVRDLTSIINSHKSGMAAPSHFHVVDMKLGNGELAAGLVDHYRSAHGHEARPIIVSGIDTNPSGLGDARSRLADKQALGQVHELDASNTVASAIRNRLECAGGSDLVLFSHAAYPSHLPSFKLPRMVDRLSDMVAPYGAVVTVHNHGASDVDQIRSGVLGVGGFSAPGLHCGTHARLQQAFAGGKMQCFSITVPNLAKLPANAKAVNAIFDRCESTLKGEDRVDAAKIRSVLEVIAGNADVLDTAIASMDDSARDAAKQHFAERMDAARGGEMAITVGGGQMVVAFRDAKLARDAFGAIQKAAEAMNPPALALPITSGLASGFDKSAAYASWKEMLQNQHGITHPPAVPQISQDRHR